MTRITRKTIAGVALAAGLVLGSPQPRAHAAVAVAGMARNVTVNFVNADLVDVLKALATQTGSNIVAGPDVKDMQISVSMKDVDLKSALDMVTQLNGMGYHVASGTYVVATPARLKEMYPTDATTAVYTLTSMKPEDAVMMVNKARPGVMAQKIGSSTVTLMGDMADVTIAKALLAQMEGSSADLLGERTTVVHNLKYLNPMEAMRAVASIVPDVLVTVGPGRSLPGSGKVGSGNNGTVETTESGQQAATPSTISAPGAEIQATAVQLNPGEEAMALLLTGYPAAIARAEDLLNKMDVAPRQVEITARVVDLTNTDAMKLGLSYSFSDLSIAEGDNANDPTGSKPRAKPLSFGQFFRVPFGVGIQLDAMATKGDTNILANPRIAAVDNRPARIFIGDTVTYVVSSSIAPTTGQPTIVTEKAHVGISLLVTPRISGDGTVTLEVHPNVSTITGFTSAPGGTSLPQISERSVDTTIHVKDGETVAIGGLIRDEEIKSMTKVPFLGDIPFFGQLFRHRNNTKTRSDVTIFITTKIVNEA
jgi:type II secretory pathway component GspD/PulD (secretin)